MLRRVIIFLSLLYLGATTPRPAFAGMPGFGLTEVAALRMETMSFFLMGLAVSSFVIQRLWNWLRNDFHWLPRLSYAKAFGLVSLWGLLFVVVLNMISGARELMTPGAWVRDGATYKLAAERPDASQTTDPLSARQLQIERLADLLRQFAQLNEGHYPSTEQVEQIPDTRWQIPSYGSMRYVYRPGLSVGDGNTPLAYEPPSDAHAVLVMLASGDIVLLSHREIARRLLAHESEHEQ